MNGQLPPIDSAIRDQLARRSAGRMPEGLLADVLTAVDSAPARRGGDGWPRLIWRVPRLAVAGLGIALVAILAVAIAFPAFHSGPAASPTRYPADRALTTAELAAVMAGPDLATNTALVAAVTIDARNDVCPMNRYPTVGVVEGMASQVCVMGGNLAARLQVPKATGTFAFRYLGPGYLGLLGEITPAPSTFPHTVTDKWPLAGKTFLVTGWLGAIGPPAGVAVSCADAPTAGDVLSPGGGDCPFTNWLSDDPAAPSIESKVVSGWQSTDDTLALRGRARYVDAGGARVIDSIDHATPTYGTYVVRSTTEQCPGAAPQDSRGCAAWLVLARVADLSLPAPSPEAITPSPTAGPSAAPPETPVAVPSGVLSPAPLGLLGSGNRPLTQVELGILMASDPNHLVGRVAVLQAPISSGMGCGPETPAPSSSSLAGCPMLLDLARSTGIWAVRIGADGLFDFLGQVSLPEGGLIFPVEHVSATSLQTGDLMILDGWLLEYMPTACDLGATPLPSACGPFSAIESTASDNSPASFYVQQGGYREITGVGAMGPPARGLYLVRVNNGDGGTLIARLEVAAP